MSRQEVRTLRVITERIESANGSLPIISGLTGSVLTTGDSSLVTAKVSTAATAAELTYAADLSAQAAMAPAAGFLGTGTVYKSAVRRIGNIINTKIIIDITGAKSSTTDLDIIGNTGAANIGQITAAINGTIVGGFMTCLEAPTTGVTDIDLYSATVGTGAYDGAIGDLTETAIVTAGGAWTLGLSKPIIAVPAANSYLYLTCGAAGTVGTYDAGIFMLEFWAV